MCLLLGDQRVAGLAAGERQRQRAAPRGRFDPRDGQLRDRPRVGGLGAQHAQAALPEDESIDGTDGVGVDDHPDAPPVGGRVDVGGDLRR